MEQCDNKPRLTEPSLKKPVSAMYISPSRALFTHKRRVQGVSFEKSRARISLGLRSISHHRAHSAPRHSDDSFASRKNR